MAKVSVKAKTGYTDRQVWDYLLANNVNLTLIGVGIIKAEVPSKLLPKLKTMADVVNLNEQTIPETQ